jgi:hypothetical protein
MNGKRVPGLRSRGSLESPEGTCHEVEWSYRMEQGMSDDATERQKRVVCPNSVTWLIRRRKG